MRSSLTLRGGHCLFVCVCLLGVGFCSAFAVGGALWFLCLLWFRGSRLSRGVSRVCPVAAVPCCSVSPCGVGGVGVPLGPAPLPSSLLPVAGGVSPLAPGSLSPFRSRVSGRGCLVLRFRGRGVLAVSVLSVAGSSPGRSLRWGSLLPLMVKSLQFTHPTGHMLITTQ